MKKSLFIVGLMLVGCTSPPTQNTVKITNLSANSGGSGSIISHSRSFSQILTNSHVCEVLKRGGLVHTTDGKSHAVSSYVQSESHDLCLVTVQEDLHTKAPIALFPPETYSHATIYGHPKLQPLTKSDGLFSGKAIIQVMTGIRACTAAESADPMIGLFCAFIGGIPIVKNYEAMSVTALIQPGSSGSGIYDDRGKISAVVFAGAGDLAYAWAVPLEYVRYFLAHEVNTLTPKVPDNTLVFAEETKPATNAVIKKVNEMCKDKKLKTTSVCELIENSAGVDDLVK